MTEKHNILITGGSGFIGTQVTHELAAQGHSITIVDRAIKHRDVPAVVVESDYLVYMMSNTIKFDTVIHLAAEHLVEQSVTSPAEYYKNNVVRMKGLLDHMGRQGIKNIIFSSSGNIYGRQGGDLPLSEIDTFYDPMNSYASTKAAGELMIKDYATAYGLNYVNFRYFNAAGADPECRFGYIQRPATYVIPILCNKILKEEVFSIYGNDYNTRDGTCIRDYVHVADIARAHTCAIKLLNAGKGNETFNIGCGNNGVSIKELVDYASQVVGKAPNIEYKKRRQGDPAILIASIEKAEQLLGWVPKYSVKDAIMHAWAWEKKYDGN